MNGSDREFKGKVVLVTGAARGQGREHAIKFAEIGASIVALDSCSSISTVPYALATKDDLEETGRLIRAIGGTVVPVEADVRDFPAVLEGVSRAVRTLGRLDIAVANAGINSAFNPVENVDEEAWDDVIDVNLKGVWHTCKCAIPLIKEHGDGGSLILISSVAGLKGIENEAAYVASKHGLIGLMRTMAKELAPHGIRVNSIHPTTVMTDMINNEHLFKLFRPDLPEPSLDDVKGLMVEVNSLPTPWIESSDVAEAATFLASARARFITGVVLPVDAGAMLK